MNYPSQYVGEATCTLVCDPYYLPYTCTRYSTTSFVHPKDDQSGYEHNKEYCVLCTTHFLVVRVYTIDMLLHGTLFLAEQHWCAIIVTGNTTCMSKAIGCAAERSAIIFREESSCHRQMNSFNRCRRLVFLRR